MCAVLVTVIIPSVLLLSAIIPTSIIISAEMLSVAIVTFVMLSVVMLSLIMLAAMLSVIVQIVRALFSSQKFRATIFFGNKNVIFLRWKSLYRKDIKILPSLSSHL
jgi:hypothetical protein